MNGSDRTTKLIYYTPDNVNGLLKTMNTCKSYRLCFDDLNSVDILDKRENATTPTKAIYPGYIQELSALKRSEKFFEIGPELRINELLKKGATVLPPILIRALTECGPPNVRNILTIGGLICAPKIRNSVFAALSILNAKAEVVSFTTANLKFLIPVQQLYRDGYLDIKPGEMILKIRIPYEEYDVDYFNEIQDKGTSITFVGTASTFKSSISICKFAIGNWGEEIIRETEIESGLAEQKLPIPEKIIEGWTEKFVQLFTEKYTFFSPYVQKALTNMFTEFLSRL
ncbi:MAG: FAD binding domain-containing protein [Spirochaetia bacterium]|nr:FAD binding domain-containing protein [Spirochaetia bacterium]MBQ3647905.1 FAD binding domain-containing protein [Spirochaetia bacterium]MBQ3712896.1 FAD binding domain-containing protein [Spirochaetia bacterium]MBQ6674461.1 FAD binding domain-containing protein [Spirochaetia bacterium]